jgi:hypothetical protein
MVVRGLAGFAALVCLTGCTASEAPPLKSVSPLEPSALAESPRPSAAISPVAAAVGSSNVIVNIHDSCDPDSFNAAIAPGACVRSGGMKFDLFIEQLTRLGFVGPWRFSPDNVSAREGKDFLVVNRGGEVHTFTEVHEFGGGIVPILNQLAGLTKVAPECLALAPSDFIAPGQTFTDEVEGDEVEHYQCCIHPWMRLTTRLSPAASH